MRSHDSVWAVYSNQGGVAEASIDMPARRTGILSAMKVGVVLSFPNDITVLGLANVQWEPWRTDGTAVAAGPISAAEYSTIPVAFKANANALPGSVTVYLGANRGRGQAYPNGAVLEFQCSSLSATGVVPGRSFIAKRLGIACWVWATAWRQPFQLVGPGHVNGNRCLSPERCEEGGVLDVVMNVGGFGQTEEQLVVQSETRVYAGLAFMLLGTITQVALCLKKKQYERWKAGHHSAGLCYSPPLDEGCYWRCCTSRLEYLARLCRRVGVRGGMVNVNSNAVVDFVCSSDRAHH